MELVDTHCHIHSAVAGAGKSDPVYEMWQKAGVTDPDAMIAEAAAENVKRQICVGTDLEDSQRAVDFVQSRGQTWATIGLHPHEAKRYTGNQKALEQFASLISRPKVVAVGECGLDYYYLHSTKSQQKDIFRYQLELGIANNLPFIFHVRDAFDDFFTILDEYIAGGHKIRGVVHSFTAHKNQLDEALARELYIGLNGIMTFTRDGEQLAAAKIVPLDKLMLETDAPFLTPKPFRGTICQPKHVAVTAKFLSELREESAGEIAKSTTENAINLFKL